jgi:hypothetical protein
MRLLPVNYNRYYEYDGEVKIVINYSYRTKISLSLLIYKIKFRENPKIASFPNRLKAQ